MLRAAEISEACGGAADARCWPAGALWLAASSLRQPAPAKAKTAIIASGQAVRSERFILKV
jgi:hypothetical protein